MQKDLFHHLISTPLGLAYIEANEYAITRLRLVPSHDYQHYVKGELCPSHPVLQQAGKALEGYFYHHEKEFNLPLAPKGTDCDKDIWQCLQEIPYGSVATYGDVAKFIGRPRAARAVGSACKRNPIWLVVPCHRVIGANQKLVGYAGGLEKKEWLIKHEECILKREGNQPVVASFHP